MNKKSVTTLCIALVMLPAMAQKSKIIYPKTAKVDTVDTYFGTKVADPYRWLENDTSRATADWVKAENKVTNAYLSKIPFRKNLLEKLTAMANYEKFSSPFKKTREVLFLQEQRFAKSVGALHAKIRRRVNRACCSTPTSCLLTGPSRSKTSHFPKDGQYMAYVISRSGSDWQEIYVMKTRRRSTAQRPHRLGEVFVCRMVRRRILLQRIRCARKGKGTVERQRRSKDLLPQNRDAAKQRHALL
jgi:prolyl oligopeptidase